MYSICPWAKREKFSRSWLAKEDLVSFLVMKEACTSSEIWKEKCYRIPSTWSLMGPSFQRRRLQGTYTTLMKEQMMSLNSATWILSYLDQLRKVKLNKSMMIPIKKLVLFSRNIIVLLTKMRTWIVYRLQMTVRSALTHLIDVVLDQGRSDTCPMP